MAKKTDLKDRRPLCSVCRKRPGVHVERTAGSWPDNDVLVCERCAPKWATECLQRDADMAAVFAERMLELAFYADNPGAEFQRWGEQGRKLHGHNLDAR
jgi:hypothetical protein